MRKYKEFVRELQKSFKTNEGNKEMKEKVSNDIKTDESYEDLQRELQQKFDELFGPIEE